MQAIKFKTLDGSTIIVNLDHFISLDHDIALDTYYLYLTTSQFELDEYTAAWIAQFLDVNDSFIPESELPKIEDVPLTTRLAQALRYDFPNGATFPTLLEHVVYPELSDRELLLSRALVSLAAENVITILPDSEIYIHRANYAKIEPLADPNIAPSEVDIASDIEIDKTINW